MVNETPTFRCVSSKGRRVTFPTMHDTWLLYSRTCEKDKPLRIFCQTHNSVRLGVKMSICESENLEPLAFEFLPECLRKVSLKETHFPRRLLTFWKIFSCTAKYIMFSYETFLIVVYYELPTRFENPLLQGTLTRNWLLCRAFILSGSRWGNWIYGLWFWEDIYDRTDRTRLPQYR